MPRRLRRLAFYPLAACLPVLGLLLAFSPPAGASTASHASPRTRAIAAAIAALKQLKVGTTRPTMRSASTTLESAD
jgi:hypothetical protein